MIDVPVLVKDALRDGRYKKNYKFKVQSSVTTRTVDLITTFTNDIRTFTVNQNVMLYVHINASEPSAEVHGQVNFPNSSGYLPFVINHTQGTEDLTALGQFLVGSVIDFSNYIGTFPEIGLTKEDLISYSTTWTDDFTIDNNTLVTESVKFDERMCSGDKLKFGLAEGSSLEFQYFNHPSIKGCRVNAEIDVEYKDTDPDWVTEKRFDDWGNQWTCEYNADYEVYVDTGSVSIMVDVSRDGHGIKSISTYLLQAGSINLGSLKRGDLIKISYLQGCSPSYIYIKRKELYKWYTIPMGYFTVSQCPMQFSTGIYKVTAYNKLKSEYLDAKANEYIEAMNPDTLGDNDDVSIRTIMDLLLQNYEIQRQKEETSLTLKVDGATIYDHWSDWTFKYVGDNTTRKAAFAFEKSLQPDGSNVPGLFAGLRLEFDVKKYLETQKTIFDNFKTYVYTYIQNPDDFMAGFKTHVVRALSLMIDPQGAYNRTYFTLDELIPDNNQATDTFDDTRYVYPLSQLYYLNNVRYFGFQLLSGFGYYANNTFTPTWQYYTDFTQYNRPHIYTEPIDDIGLISVNKNKLADVTLRDIISANYELKCQYGRLDRETDLFYGTELNNAWLYPRDDLYPASNLYPGGGGLTAHAAYRSTYSKLWTDQAGEQTFRNLIITYKGLDDEDKETEFQLVVEVNANGTTDYVINDNWLFKNLVWSYSDVADLANEMVAKLRGVHWFPFEMWAAGLPYIETGDEIEIIIGQNTYTSYVLQRQLNGIQNLQDTYINGTLEIF